MRVHKLLIAHVGSHENADNMSEFGDSDLPVVDVGETILDSGAARHLIATRYTLAHKAFLRILDLPVPLITASGADSTSQESEFIHSDLGDNVCALVLPDTPSVLSLGILVIE